MTEIDFTPEIPCETIWQKIVLFFRWLWSVYFPVIFLYFILHDYNEKTPENPLWPEPYHSLPALLPILLLCFFPVMNTIETLKVGIFAFMKKQQEAGLKRKANITPSDEYVPQWIKELEGFVGLVMFLLFIFSGFYLVGLIEANFHLPKDDRANALLSYEIGIATVIAAAIFYGKMRKLWVKPRHSQ